MDFQSPRREVLETLSFHIAVELFLAALGELSSSHFAHVFKESTGLTASHFITRQRITRAQQLIRETSRSLIEVGLDVGLEQPEPFRAGLPPRGWCLTNGVPQLALAFLERRELYTKAKFQVFSPRRIANPKLQLTVLPL